MKSFNQMTNDRYVEAIELLSEVLWATRLRQKRGVRNAPIALDGAFARVTAFLHDLGIVVQHDAVVDGVRSGVAIADGSSGSRSVTMTLLENSCARPDVSRSLRACSATMPAAT